MGSPKRASPPSPSIDSNARGVPRTPWQSECCALLLLGWLRLRVVGRIQLLLVLLLLLLHVLQFLQHLFRSLQDVVGRISVIVLLLIVSLLVTRRNGLPRAEPSRRRRNLRSLLLVVGFRIGRRHFFFRWLLRRLLILRLTLVRAVVLRRTHRRGCALPGAQNNLLHSARIPGHAQNDVVKFGPVQ